MDVGTLSVLLLFGFIPLAIFTVIFVVSLFRFKARNRMADVIEQYASLDKDPPAEIIKAIGLPRRQPHTDLKRGMIAIALGISAVIFGALIPDDEATVVFAGLAAFPIFVGIAMLLFWYFVGRKTENV